MFVGGGCACVRINNCLDCLAGKGPETIFAGQNLNDNEWHTVRVFRRGKSLKLTVDDLPPVEGTLTQRHFSPSECKILCDLSWSSTHSLLKS